VVLIQVEFELEANPIRSPHEVSSFDSLKHLGIGVLFQLYEISIRKISPGFSTAESYRCYFFNKVLDRRIIVKNRSEILYVLNNWERNSIILIFGFPGFLF